MRGPREAEPHCVLKGGYIDFYIGTRENKVSPDKPMDRRTNEGLATPDTD